MPSRHELTSGGARPMPPGAITHLGRPLRSFAELDSSSDELWRWAEGGAPHGACVRAESQSAGRGRQGRSWHSPPGGGLYFSVLLRPSSPLSRWNAFSLAAGIAILRAVESQYDLPVRLKWPNDLLLYGKKLGGLLCETRDAAGPALAVGIGLNLVAPAGGWPAELKARATSIGEASEAAGLELRQVDDLFVACLAELERGYHLYSAGSLGPFLADLRQRDALAGLRIRYEGPGGAAEEGRAAGIDADGSLCVDSNGERRRLFAGEVHLLAEQD